MHSAQRWSETRGSFERGKQLQIKSHLLRGLERGEETALQRQGSCRFTPSVEVHSIHYRRGKLAVDEGLYGSPREPSQAIQHAVFIRSAPRPMWSRRGMTANTVGYLCLRQCLFVQRLQKLPQAPLLKHSSRSFRQVIRSLSRQYRRSDTAERGDRMCFTPRRLAIGAVNIQIYGAWRSIR